MYRPSGNSGFNHSPPFIPHFQRNPNRGGRWPGQLQKRGRPYLQSNSEEYWCETCDRGFPNADKLAQHKQEHQKCNIDGCQFVAHPKVITKHIQMQHSSGLFKKIANLNNPEEIKKWREERKKRFPTKANVDKKAAEQKEKIERGEKMGLMNVRDKRSKKLDEAQKRPHPSGTENYNKNRNKLFNFQKNKKKKMPLKIEKDVPKLDENRNLKPFAGIQGLVESETEDQDEPNQSDFLIEDEDDNIHKKGNIEACRKLETPALCGALSTLICEYGSSDDELSHEITPQVVDGSKDLQEHNLINKNPTLIKHQLSNGDSKNDSDHDSGPEETSINKTANEQLPEPIVQSTTCPGIGRKTKNKIPVKRPTLNKKPKKKLPSTLLQKLLHREIQHERNIVLQCIRHIVRNNYFDN